MINSANLDLLQAQRITEKTARSSSYVFKVRSDATKTTIKKLIQDVYGAKVKSVNVLNRKGKHKARRNGYTKSFKIAYVTLEQGQELNLTE